MGPTRVATRRRGDFPTPPALVDLVVEHALAPVASGATVRVLDPACGDGRFLIAAGRRIAAAGGRPELYGVDIHPPAVDAAVSALTLAGLGPVSSVVVGDARLHDWPTDLFDVVVGNPPFRSPLVDGGERAGAGGPYADLAAEFLALAVSRARPAGGRVGLVLPQSILAARDAGPVRAAVVAAAELVWSWWSPGRHFDAQVVVCAVVVERRPGPATAGTGASWGGVVIDALGVPAVGPLATDGCLADWGRVTANFRDQYYGLIGAVDDDRSGPSLVTSGLIDPGHCRWGQRPVRFGGRRFERPRVELAALTPALRRWAEGLLVPKVLVANQTRVIEAVADPAGAWLPGVPVLTVRPAAGAAVAEVAAVLTSPVATAWAWHRAAGTGLSATALRLGPRWLAELPWPAGPLDDAVAALAAGDVERCGASVLAAYGRAGDDPLLAWWSARLPAHREGSTTSTSR